MKLQSLAIIFVIIILPISIIMSAYVQTQIDTMVMQTNYDTQLSNATYDAIKAFQLNQLNSNTRNVSSERIRDIEASITSFYNSLGTNFGTSGANAEDLSLYIPALVYTLYDGYYIYSAYDNIAENPTKLEQGLKPYVYYSARYTRGFVDIVVNYTLDNYVTIYGTDKNGNYGVYGGYLIDPNSVFLSGGKPTYKTPSGVNVTIEPETLTEVSGESYKTNQLVEYVYFKDEDNNVSKAYKASGNTWFMYNIDGTNKIDVTDKVKAQLGNNPKDTSAITYYNEAKTFTQLVQDKFGDITLDDILLDPKDSASNESLKRDVGITSTNKSEPLFKNYSGTNSPENVDSTFYQHKRAIIRNSIQTNLSAAIASYNAVAGGIGSGSTFAYKMPTLKESEWDLILNNTSLISFMQGLPLKSKYYMGYNVVVNNQNREYVDPDLIYLVDGEVFHDVRHAANTYGMMGYRNIDFKRMKILNNDGNPEYYYPQKQTGDYECIVTSSGNVRTKEQVLQEPGNGYIRQAYYTALGRERYATYKAGKLYTNN